ncbi:hypothetical protein [Bdellovibrio sp. HCB337]|uniref:hypothetical protein n=1 Tax=Bdellovibrio sp. HCB337 TaxID=3394358 RepID=UPI0039A46079
MKTLFSFSVLTLTLISSLSFAREFEGVKEGGGDDSRIFECQTLPVVDSDLSFTGLDQGTGNEIALSIAIDGIEIAREIGTWDPETKTYTSSGFKIKTTRKGKVTATGENYLYNVGSSEALSCTRF